MLRSLLGDREGTTQKMREKYFAERSGELSGAICLKTLVLLGNDPVTPSNCSEISLVLFRQCLACAVIGAQLAVTASFCI